MSLSLGISLSKKKKNLGVKLQPTMVSPRPHQSCSGLGVQSRAFWLQNEEKKMLTIFRENKRKEAIVFFERMSCILPHLQPLSLTIFKRRTSPKHQEYSWVIWIARKQQRPFEFWNLQEALKCSRDQTSSWHTWLAFGLWRLKRNDWCSLLLARARGLSTCSLLNWWFS